MGRKIATIFLVGFLFQTVFGLGVTYSLYSVALSEEGVVSALDNPQVYASFFSHLPQGVTSDVLLEKDWIRSQAKQLAKHGLEYLRGERDVPVLVVSFEKQREKLSAMGLNALVESVPPNVDLWQIPAVQAKLSETKEAVSMVRWFMVLLAFLALLSIFLLVALAETKSKKWQYPGVGIFLGGVFLGVFSIILSSLQSEIPMDFRALAQPVLTFLSEQLMVSGYAFVAVGLVLLAVGFTLAGQTGSEKAAG